MFLRPRIIYYAIFPLFFFLLNNKTFAQVDAGNDTSICTNSHVVYAIPPGGYWTTAGTATIVSPSTQSSLVTGLEPGINQFMYTVEGTGSDIINITNNQVTANAGSDRISSCLSYADLSGNSAPPGGTGVWANKYNIPGITIDNNSSVNTQVHNLPFGNTIFTWTISYNGCSSTDEVSINNNTPENNDGFSQASCSKEFYIDAEMPPPGGNGFWTQIAGPGVVEFDNSLSPGVQITTPIGQSTVRWTLNYLTCSSFKDFTLENLLPKPNAGSNQQLCVNNTNLLAQPPLASENGYWTIIDPQTENISNASIYNPSVSNLKTGTTTFVWHLNNSFCSATDSVQIINNLPEVYAGRDTTICNSTYSLLANNPFPNSGLWTCPGHPEITIDNAGSFNAFVSNLSNGSYDFIWSVNNGTCESTDLVTVHSNFVQISTGITINSGCADTLELTGTSIPLGGSGIWTLLSGNATLDEPTVNHTIVRNIDETIRLRWTIYSGGCTYTDENEYQNQLPTTAVAQPDKAICTNQTIITANAPIQTGESGLWTYESGVPGSNIESAALFQTNVTNIGLGSTTYKWTISNSNCSSSDWITVSNNQITTFAGNDESLCISSTNLNAAVEPGTGYWSSSSGAVVFSNSTNPTSGISNIPIGSHTFTWTRNYNGCTASDQVVITNNSPSPVFAGVDEIVCDTSATLNATNPLFGSGVWTSTGAAVIVNPSSNQTGINSLNPGINTFRWTVSNGSCVLSDEVNITNNKINVSAGADQVVCNTNVANLSATVPLSNQSGIWTIVGGSGNFSDPTSFNTTVNNLIKGLNTYKWTLTDGFCSGSADVSIVNNTPDSAKVAADKIICSDLTIINAVAVSNGTGTWTLGSGSGNIASPGNNNTLVSQIGTGQNVFTWTVTKNGCSLSANQMVTNNSVIASISDESISICRTSHDTILVANEPSFPATSAVWSVVSSGTGIIEDPSNFTTRVYNLSNGETRFRWTVQNSNCSASDEIRVIDDYYNPNASTVGSPNICTNQVSVIGNPGPPSGSNVWSANNVNITFVNPSNVTTTVQNIPLGQNTIFWTISNNGCIAQTSFVITNNTLSTNAGVDIVGCSSDTVLAAQELGAGESGFWTSSNIAVFFVNSLSPTTAVSNVPLGTSVLTWNITANGCSASDAMILVNNSFMVSAGIDKTICTTASSIEGTDPLTGNGIWSLVNGDAIITSPSSKYTTLTNLQNGINTFRWTVSRSGCTASDEVSVINDLYLADILPVNDVCEDTSLVQAQSLPVGSGASGLWQVLSGGGTFDNNSVEQSVIRNLGLGTNQIRWTVTKGACISIDNATINNNTVIVYAGPDQNTCESSTGLYATPLAPTATGIWTGPTGVVIETPSTPGTIVTNLPRGITTFTWTVTDKGCTGFSNINIYQNSFDAYAGNDQILTTPTAQMGATLPDITASGSWQILTGNGTFTSVNDPVTLVNSLGYGINQFRWNVSWNTCNAYDDVQVIYNVAEAYAGGDQFTCGANVYTDADVPVFGIGTWSVVQGAGTFSNANQAKTLLSNIGPGINIYRWTVDAFSIVAYDEMSVTNNAFITNAGIDQQTCNSFASLSAQAPAPGGSGFWTVIQGSGSFSNNFVTNPDVSNMITGNNTFVWRVDQNNCYDTDTVTILRYQNPTIANAGIDDMVCNRNYYNLQGNLPSIGTGTWTSDNPLVTIDNTAFAVTMARNLSTGPNTFRWTTITQYCQSWDEVVISSYQTISITSQPLSQAIVEHLVVNFTVVTNGNPKSFRWQKNGLDLVDGGRITGSQSNILNIADLQMSDAGQYQCIVEGYCNTVSSDVAILSVVSGFETIDNQMLSVYPNPSKGIFHLASKTSLKIKNLTITDMNGKSLYVKPELKPQETINLSHFTDGMYFLNVNIGEKIIKSKIIIQK